MRRWVTSAVLVVATVSSGMAVAQGTVQPTTDAVPILNSRSFWRVGVWHSEVPIRMEDGRLEKPLKKIDAPENWQKVDFDDSAWVRMPGPFFPNDLHNAGWVGWSGPGNESPLTALIRIRGRFIVNDPTAVKSLSLNLSYRGGAVVYLNGAEVGRGHMPAGHIAPETPAEAYPDEAFVVPDGSRAISGGYGDPQKFMERIKKRWRSTQISIEPKHLRRGINVLCVELHRAPYNEIATRLNKAGWRELKPGRDNSSNDDYWSTVGLIDLSLSTVGGGVAPNVTRPKGFQVWNADPLLVIYDTDYGDEGVPPMPVKIAAARNGRHSGVLVVGSDRPIERLRAKVSDMTAAGGGAIPASAVEIRYQLPGDADATGNARLPGGQGDICAFDTLSPTAPAVVEVRAKNLKGQHNVVFGAVCPIWLTVHVPADCKPGLYKGNCTIEAQGVEPVKVPVEVHVSDWGLPPPYKFRTAVGFHQSPESVALNYNVPLWSDEHFKLLAESYRWLGSVGCKTLFIHVIERTNLGNAESVVRWKRRVNAPASSTGATNAVPRVSAATHEPDFTVFDRFLDLALEHLVEPPVICLYAWDNYCGTWYHGSDSHRNNIVSYPVRVTELLPDGKTRSALGPAYTNIAESVEFWKPVGEHAVAYLKKRGLEKSLTIGVAHDSWPSKFVADVWRQVLPEASWTFEGHPECSSIYGVPVKWCCTVWNARFNLPFEKHGWRRNYWVCHFDRDNWRLDAQSQLLSHGHLAGEKNITGAQRGFGRMSADLWPVISYTPNENIHVTRRARQYSISGRYPESGWGACDLRQNPFLKPGANGAVSTGRLEMIREGLQECEARIFIESVLNDPGKASKLERDLIDRCHKLLNLRQEFANSSVGLQGAIRFLGTGRLERVRELFSLAGEVERQLRSGS